MAARFARSSIPASGRRLRLGRGSENHRERKPITIRGVRYTVLRLDLSARGPRFLLRDNQGRVSGIWPHPQSRLIAQLLEPVVSAFNPLDGIELAEGDDELVVRR